MSNKEACRTNCNVAPRIASTHLAASDELRACSAVNRQAVRPCLPVTSLPSAGARAASDRSCLKHVGHQENDRRVAEVLPPMRHLACLVTQVHN